ncbi:GGDEF domain-containing protein [Bacillus sp. HNG]|uniref:GGDEF domain-containing protein n=1 Tax=Bacillus sp. HNG TaxID=2293325 RepID=UPI000E2F25EC|nr:GGDEF domain-containing protein [Bacillus sp. HNG]RFB13333.1 GGDEF domain-containing protein [Bacillus sp. HNG]
MDIVIGEIAKESFIVSPSTKCEEVYTIFEKETAIEGIVVCSDQKPVGLVMKTHFFQRLSIKYGFDLFMKRTIDLVMDQEILIVDYHLSLTEVSSLAMNRKLEHLYDVVIVTKGNALFGTVSIRELIMKLAEIQIRNARYSNPLTGLPGNNVIKETLIEVLTYKRFSVLYIDIDSFKAFNDTYGFSKGDELIKETAMILTDVVMTTENEPSFIGHIGGDDFIATIPHHHYQSICESIIAQFADSLKIFYTQDDLSKGYVSGVSRQGVFEKLPLASISIAVIQNSKRPITSLEQLSLESAKVKSYCKTTKNSIYLTLDDYEQQTKEKTLF